MARVIRTADQFDASAAILRDAAESLASIAQSMREAGMADALVHATLPEKTHMPAIVDWTDKLKIDVRSQIRALADGFQSSAEKSVEQHARTKKLAAAKKSVKKVPPKR